MHITYQADLNPAQLEAVTTVDGPVLVIAGAGSGKTRTIVYRLAHLVERGVRPEEILLLTFTRKASNQMLERVQHVLGHSRLGAVRGGTFHGFAYSLLKQYATVLGFERGASIMDRADAEEIFGQAKDRLDLGRKDRKFPKRSTIASLWSKSRNKELSLAQVLHQDAYHLKVYEDDLIRWCEEYGRIKQECGLMDYDDLLFLLERLLSEHPYVREAVSASLSHIMVDEYQDTNLVQARLVHLLTQPDDPAPNIMAVGDDAQSIYAFRGANVRNILDFPKMYPQARLIKLERNYRSTQPILHLTNAVLKNFTDTFAKELYSDRDSEHNPEHIATISDRTQARLVAETIRELADTYALNEIAVLFRAGYQSYHVEVELTKSGLAFRKYGGIKFADAAHIKDVLACLRISQNMADFPAWQRILRTVPGIGPKTAQKIFQAAMINDQTFLLAQRRKHANLNEVLDILDTLRTQTMRPGTAIGVILEYYLPVLRETYPDDYPRREAGLEELVQIALSYDDMTSFLGDLSLDSPEAEEASGQAITLSTVHSAKGLEWDAVLVIDLVEERFPSRHALNDAGDFAEERRLFYVACTRARERLILFSPESIYSRECGCPMPVRVSPFIEEIPDSVVAAFREQIGGGVGRRSSMQAMSAPSPQRELREYEAPQEVRPQEQMPARSSRAVDTPTPGSGQTPVQGTYCRHKIFGRGKVVSRVEPNKYKINFPGFGLKLIIEDFVELEQP
ncbi:MAG: ATP-dependent helicase [Desulfovibrionales bacterium]|nr:ATP-dependent helicase [Desulfovibrionales bacterium]